MAPVKNGHLVSDSNEMHDNERPARFHCHKKPFRCCLRDLWPGSAVLQRKCGVWWTQQQFQE